MSAQTFRLPTPPSANGLYANVRPRPGATKGRARAKTSAYKSWIESAGWELKRQRVQPITGPVVIEIRVRRTSPRADISNRIKATEDLLVRHGLINDDRLSHKVSAEWDNSVEDCVVTVRPRA